MNKLKKYLPAGLLLPLMFAGCFTGCIKQSLDDCRTLSISLNYDPVCAQEDVKTVQRVDIFAFDTLGVLQAVWPNNDAKKPLVFPNLPAGEYRLIAWTAPKDGYTIAPDPKTFIPGTTTLNDINLIVMPPNDTVEYRPIFQVDDTITILNQPGPQSIAVSLTPTYCTMTGDMIMQGIGTSNYPDLVAGAIMYDNWDGRYKLDRSRNPYTVPANNANSVVYKPYNEVPTADPAQIHIISDFRIAQILPNDKADGRDLDLQVFNAAAQTPIVTLPLFSLGMNYQATEPYSYGFTSTSSPTIP